MNLREDDDVLFTQKAHAKPHARRASLNAGIYIVYTIYAIYAIYRS